MNDSSVPPEDPRRALLGLLLTLVVVASIWVWMGIRNAHSPDPPGLPHPPPAAIPARSVPSP